MGHGTWPTPTIYIYIYICISKGKKIDFGMDSVSQIEQGALEAEKEDEAFMFALQLANASIPTMALRTVIELGLLKMMANAGLGAYVSPSELVAQLPTKNPDAPAMIDRILQILACNSILNCSLRELPDGGVERLYGLAPVCKFLISDTDGDSMAPHLFMSNHKVMMESWYYVKDAILEGGIPFEKAHGMTVYEYYATNPTLNKVFTQAMTSQSTLVTKKLLKVYRGFKGLSLLVDVGGNSGATLNTIISKYPTIKGINFDLPHVIKNAPSYPGVEHVGGNMFVSIPKGDAIFMKLICHNWDDERCLKLLKNCFEALPENGKVIAAEYIFPEVPDNKLFTKNVIQLDLNMLVHSNGGKQRTEKEFQALAKGAGFEGLRVACCAANICIMEFFKKI